VGVKGAIEQAEVHGAGWGSEAEAVGGAEAGKAVGALLEFIADAETPPRGVAGRLGERGELKAAGVVAADDHGEGVFEAEGLGGDDVVAGGVETADGLEDAGGVSRFSGFGKWLFDDGGEGGAGVFDVGIDAAGYEGLVADVAAGEIEAALDLEVGFGFDLLGEKFAEDDLFGEVFCADDWVVRPGRGAGGEEG